jgi:hypothetical protein
MNNGGNQEPSHALQQVLMRNEQSAAFALRAAGCRVQERH